jgi:hypothetical protein
MKSYECSERIMELGFKEKNKQDSCVRSDAMQKKLE